MRPSRDNPAYRIARAPYNLMARTLERLPAFAFVRETRDNATPITFDMWFRQQFFGGEGRDAYWPMHPASRVYNWRNVLLGVDVAPGYMPGCYVQAFGPVRIGDYTRVAPNVGLISANHDVRDGRAHHVSSITIGRYCWLAMGSVVLPDVTLGDFTTVAANAVVTRSFPDGYVVLAGAPARPVKSLDPSECVRHEVTQRYHGYLRAADFPAFAARELAPGLCGKQESCGNVGPPRPASISHAAAGPG